jgi:rhamnosyltransferase subunit B
VYLGSMAGRALGPLYRTIVEAVLRNGARALVIGSTADSLDLRPTGKLFVVPFAPFSEVFRPCAAVVHHGGIGTVGRVLQAGLPMLVVPWGYDQFVTAMMMVESGIGRTITARQCSVRRATKALDGVLADHRYRAAATATSSLIAAEDGVGNLSRCIEDLLDDRRP